MNSHRTQHLDLSRRAFLARGGALVVSFSLAPAWAQQKPEAQNVGREPRKPLPLPGSLKDAPLLDAWIRIDADGAITVFTGKAELGQGIRTALIQCAAEELSVEPHAITLVTADTGRTPNEGYTAGSHSMQDSGTAIRHAAAQVRAILIRVAAEQLKQPADQLVAQNGVVRAPDGRSVAYSKLVEGQALHVNATQTSPLKDPGTHAVMGKPLPRVDIPGKLTGAPMYVQDLRLPGMLHARVVPPPSYGARLESLDTSQVEKMPGVMKIVRDGNYLAVIAAREYQAVSAMRVLAQSARWQERPSLPAQADIYAYLQKLPVEDYVILGGPRAPSFGERSFEATYRRPYQMHASIGPSCAVAQYDKDALTVWTHSQGVYPLRNAIAEMLKLPPERVRCIHVEGSGCYGHNAADDAGADAALIAYANPGPPVRVQWMREQEHAWEPYGPAMIMSLKASLDAEGRVSAWQHEVWSNPHSTRPAPAGNLQPAWQLAKPFTQPPAKPLPQPEGGGDRNAIPLYSLPNARVVHHFIPAMPLRVSALRALGAYGNIFALESFMDELARAAKSDPVQFRLRHMEEPRARDVINLAAQRFGWADYKAQRGHGRGFAFARYKNLGAYAALAFEVDVDRNTGRVRVLRAVAAVDSGEAVNPDGIRNQVEGGIVQSLSWTLYESVSFDTTRITSRDWSTYPMLRFPDVPLSIDVHVIDRPGQPFLGTGEATQGPASAALANAVADATGVRIRDLPLSPQRVKAAIGL
jgi:nicotinate dehydrogenase subunit B